MQSSIHPSFALITVACCLSTACDANLSEPSDTKRSQPLSSLETTQKNTNAQTPLVQAPEIQQPEIQQPEITIPEIQQPEITIPEITIPEIRVQQGENLTIITIASDILFDFDQDTIRPDAETALEQVNAAIANRYPQSSIHIQGHTDSIGSEAYNQNLSERRAASVRRWLEQQGDVAGSRLTTSGWGESRPVAPNTESDGSDNPAGRQKNRRVEVVIQGS